MEEKDTWYWKSNNALPLISATIQITMEETERQHNYLLQLKNATYYIDKNLAHRITTFYQSQLDNIMHYEEQLCSWLTKIEIHNDNTKMVEISDLLRKVKKLKTLSQSIIQTAALIVLVENEDSFVGSSLNQI